MDMETLGMRPGVIMVGSQSVGKRTLLSRKFLTLDWFSFYLLMILTLNG